MDVDTNRAVKAGAEEHLGHDPCLGAVGPVENLSEFRDWIFNMHDLVPCELTGSRQPYSSAPERAALRLARRASFALIKARHDLGEVARHVAGAALRPKRGLFNQGFLLLVAAGVPVGLTQAVEFE